MKGGLKKKEKGTACEERGSCPFVVSPESWRVRKLGSLFVFHGWEVKREKEAIKKGGKEGRERFFFLLWLSRVQETQKVVSLVLFSKGSNKGEG